MSKTETAAYRFTVKEGQASARGKNDAPVWLMLEPTSGDLSVLRSGFLALRLAPGADIAKGQEVARFLNENIKGVSFTEF
jgi:hypothetical protein